MAAAVTATYSNEGTGTSVSVASVVLAAGDVADVQVSWRANADQTCDSVHWNGSATGVTQNANSASAGGRIGLASFRIVGQTGTQTVAGNFSAAVGSGASIVVNVLSGVDNTTPLADTVQVATDLGGELGALSGTTTLANGDLNICSVVTLNNVVSTLAANSGQTDLVTANLAGTDITYASSSEGGTGSVTSGYTWDGTFPNGWFARLIVVPYLAASGGGGVVGPLLAGHLTGGGILAGGRLVN